MDRFAIRRTALLTLLTAGALGSLHGAESATEQVFAGPESRDYGLMWWPHGWRTVDWSASDRTPQKLVRCVQTGHYAMAMDTGSMQILHLGPIEEAKSYIQATNEGDEAVFALPAAELRLTIAANGIRYRCVRGAHPRLIDGGRFLQRGDIVGLLFLDETGEPLATNARLEVTSWPETLSFELEAGPAEPATAAASVSEGKQWADVSLEIELTYAGRTYKAKRAVDSGGILKVGNLERVSLSVLPADPQVAVEEPAGVKVAAHDPVSGKPVVMRWMPNNSCYRIDMNGEAPSDPRRDYFDSVLFKVENTTEQPMVIPLWFHQAPCSSPIGISPVLRESDGTPTGIPVQISKDWHTLPDGAPYDKTWLHSYTVLHVPPRDAVNYRLDLAHAYWGSLPAASHAQLSLLGWDRRADQQWEQVAIGSWGEVICYDPEVNLNRSFIDDIRPLFVNGTAGLQWSWTNNVGGGEFLTYRAAEGQSTRLQRMKTAYLRYCPVMTEAMYSGITADKAIRGRYMVSTVRANDFPRHFHSLRFDVLAPVAADRLSFYQLGAPGYNENWFSKIARGNAAAGLIEEWDIQRSSKTYDRTGIAADGAGAWFSLHAVDPAKGNPPAVRGASRGLIVRAWKARLGGSDAPVPYFSVFGAPPSALLELSAPPGITKLLPGDYVEATLEMVVIPAIAAEYYGTDTAFRTILTEGANTWQPVHAEAKVGSGLKVELAAGELERLFPVTVRAEGNRVELSITGAIGYAPITITGLSGYRNPLMEVRSAEGTWQKVDQSKQGNDFWQTDYDVDSRTWSITYTIPPDMLKPDQTRLDLRFRVEGE